MTGDTQWLRADVLRSEGLQRPHDRLSLAHLPIIDEHVELAPYACYWLVEVDSLQARSGIDRPGRDHRHPDRTRSLLAVGRVDQVD